MPANKNALIRYKTIDRCLRNPYRRWTLEDLVDACSEAIYEAEGISKGVSVRTVQADIQMMRSSKLGYEAPIEVYEKKYYRYSDPDFSIMTLPISQKDFDVLSEAVDMLGQFSEFSQFAELADVIGWLQNNFYNQRDGKKPIVHFDNVSRLKGLGWLNPLYNHIARREAIKITYKPFRNKQSNEYIVCPHLLKEFRNRWFLFATRTDDNQLFNYPLDRILSFEKSDEPYRDNPDFDSEHFFDDVIGVSKNIGDRPVKILFETDWWQGNYIQTKPLHTSQTMIEKLDEGRFLFSIEVVPNYEFYSMMMSYGPGVKVVSPTEIVATMLKYTSEAASQYLSSQEDTERE